MTMQRIKMTNKICSVTLIVHWAVHTCSHVSSWHIVSSLSLTRHCILIIEVQCNCKIKLIVWLHIQRNNLLVPSISLWNFHELFLSAKMSLAQFNVQGSSSECESLTCKTAYHVNMCENDYVKYVCKMLANYTKYALHI